VSDHCGCHCHRLVAAMLGGKKLKDLTEEEIRNLAATLASRPGDEEETGGDNGDGTAASPLDSAAAGRQPLEADGASLRSQAPEFTAQAAAPQNLVDFDDDENELLGIAPRQARSVAPSAAPVAPAAPVVPVDAPRDGAPREAPAVDPHALAKAIAERGINPEEDVDENGPTSTAKERLERALVTREEEDRLRQEEEDKARIAKFQAEEDAKQAILSEEEQLRLQVLADLERSQMPAVKKDDGLPVKTIEHYTFSDSSDVASISIEFDKDLFEGASGFVSDNNVEVSTQDSEVTILLHGLPASKTIASLCDWRLHLAPLFHTVDPDETKWKIRKGKLSVKLKKRKMQDWRRVLKF